MVKPAMVPVILFATYLGGVAAAPTYAQGAKIRIIAPRTYVISGYTNGNILALEGNDRVLLVDGQSAQRVHAADTLLRTITDKRVSMVVSTHYHEDHTGGNTFWRSRGATVLAHQNFAIDAAKDTFIAERNWRRRALPATALPTVAFDDSTVVQLDAETITVYGRTAHTHGDAIVWVPSRNVLHMGDIVEIGAPPFIDWWAGGTLEGMISAVEFALKLTNDSTIIVPGHGPPIDRAMLRSYGIGLLAASASCESRKNPVARYACRPVGGSGGGTRPPRSPGRVPL